MTMEKTHARNADVDEWQGSPFQVAHLTNYGGIDAALALVNDWLEK
jgi:hypothetical protein